MRDLETSETHGAAEAELYAELDARLAALERRERELEQALEAVESQRRLLVAVRSEYEARRATLAARTLEVEAERDRLRAEGVPAARRPPAPAADRRPLEAA